MNRELLLEILIPLYRRTYVSSNSIRPKYFEKGKKKLPAMYCDPVLYKQSKMREPDGVKYFWRSFPVTRKRVKRMVDFLVSAETDQRVVANEKRVGTQSISNISGEDLIYGGGRHQRNSMLNQIKAQLVQHIMSKKPINRFPIIIELELFDLLENDPYCKHHDWDVDNRALPYNKAFQDVLQECHIIPKDTSKYITGPPQTLFTPVENTNDRKLIYRIYVDRRPHILTNPILQQFHGSKLG